MAYVVLSGGTVLRRAVLGRWRVLGAETRSVLDTEGGASAWGEPASPNSSRRNLNLDRKSCQTTYQPKGSTLRDKERERQGDRQGERET